MQYKESAIQITFLDYIEAKHPKLRNFMFHIPNGGKMGAFRGSLLKRLGVKAGVADILFMLPNKDSGCLWLEFKSEKGKQTETQVEFEKLCHIARQDYAVVKSVDEAITAFTTYMSH